MEHVRHYLGVSRTGTLRGFVASEAVDFDPPSPSLRLNIMKFKARLVHDLAAGATGDAEEDEIRDLMTRSENSYELIRLVQAIGGWSDLDDELTESYVDQVARQVAQVLDQRDYLVYQLIRRYLILLDYEASPNLGACFVKLLQWPARFQPGEFDMLLRRKAELLEGITSATMRNRARMIDAARIGDAVITQYRAAAPHRADELVGLMYEVTYTAHICSALAQLDYAPIFGLLRNAVDPLLSVEQRAACHATFDRLLLEFEAAQSAVPLYGSLQSRADVGRLMALRSQVLDGPPGSPNPALTAAIDAAMAPAAGGAGALLAVAEGLIQAISRALSVLDPQDDNDARGLATQLNAQGRLARLPFNVKDRMVKALLSGNTESDDENAIFLILETARFHDQAELYQLVASATWAALSFSVNGAESDDMYRLLTPA